MKNLLKDEKRQVLERNKILDRHIRNTNKKLRDKYRGLSLRIINAIDHLLNELRAEEDNSLANYHNYQRYYGLLLQIEKDCSQLAKTEQEILEEEMLELYFIFYALEPLEGSADRHKAQSAVDGVWVSDGKHWQERVWEHEGELYNKLDRILTDAVVAGIPVEEVIEAVKRAFDISYNEAKRLVDTEYSHIMSKADEDKFIANGVEFFRYVAIHDEKTCTACKQRDGRVFRVGDKLNTPPIHPNGRCAMIPIKNKNVEVE